MKSEFAVVIVLLSVLMVPPVISGVNPAEGAETSTGDYSIRYDPRVHERAFIKSLIESTEGTINVNTNIESATFTISGPATYSGSGTFWSQSNAPPGTYTITYESVSMYYGKPPSETKTLSAGGSITFSGHYDLVLEHVEKKSAGDSIDLRDGFILLISEVDPEVGEVLMELQLDDHIIDDKILKKGERYWLEKYYYKEDCYIDVVDIGHETTGDYVILSSVICHYFLILHIDLIIASVPQGADIYLDGEYVGKTTRKISVIPDFKMHSLRLVLSGYEEEEQTFKFEQGEMKKEIQMTLRKIEPTPTSRPPLTPSTPTPSTPAPTSVSPAYSPTPTPPGFLAITVILAILCGFLILKRKHS